MQSGWAAWDPRQLEEWLRQGEAGRETGGERGTGKWGGDRLGETERDTYIERDTDREMGR